MSLDITSEARAAVLNYVASNGPVTYAEIADAVDIQRSTARDHVTSLISEDGVDLRVEQTDGKKVFNYETNEHPITPSVPTQQLRSKAKVTKDAKETVHELIQYLQDDLHGRAPAVSDSGLSVRDSHEDMVCHRSDDHIGAKYTDEFGNSTFNAELGIKRVRTVSDRVFQLKARQEAAGVDFDTFHLVMGGDHLHGAGIHDNQPWECELSIPQQITIAGDIYMEFIDRASQEFPSVQVVCQVGNHGELRGDGYGPDDNVDTAFFMVLDRRIRDRGYDNVRMVRSQSSNFTNFKMRRRPEEDKQKAEALDCEPHELPADVQSGHRAHLRHGQNSLEHVGTSSGKKRWYAWKDQHEFDIAYRGHYHTFQMDSIASTPIVESGAIVPPADFEESLAEWDEPAATVHGVTDERPISWLYPIDFSTPPTEEESNEKMSLAL